MSSLYCEMCGTPARSPLAKFCGKCQTPFDPSAVAPKAEPVIARTPAATRQRPTRRPVAKATNEDTEDEVNDGEMDDSYVPALDKIEIDVEVYSTRESIRSVAGTSGYGSFKRPDDKVPKNDAEFRNDFLVKFQQEAGPADRTIKND